MNIRELGFDEYFDKCSREYREKGLYMGRVFIEHRGTYRLYTEFGELTGEVSGKMRYSSFGTGDYPAVGDWVAISPRLESRESIIHGVLPRKSKFSRKSAGFQTEEQVVASNFDTVFIVSALNKNYSLRRIERYLTTAFESGGNPVIILSKADLCDNIDEKVREVEAAAIGVAVHAVSSVTGLGMEKLMRYFEKGKTVAVMGSSGVGKSTLINCLAKEEVLKVQETREEDDKGRHTTTHRELVLLKSGGLIIDTPGMRELQLWDGDEGIRSTFNDIESMAVFCKFKDCKHESEPGCAVKEAIRSGSLDEERLKSYKKLQRELLYIESKQRQIERINDKKKRR